MTQTEWTRENFAGSVTENCFVFEGLNNDPWEEVCDDDEARLVFELEQSIGTIPAWAQDTLKMNNFPWWCPHYLFPMPILDIVEAIGAERAPTAIHGCYMVGRDRKERMADYVFCLDAWLAGVASEDAAQELLFRKRQDCDWRVVCLDLWSVLEEHSEIKDLTVERIIHRQRWWLKATTWDDDPRTCFGRDQYLGNAVSEVGLEGRTAMKDPFYGEMESPRVANMKLCISNLAPDWESTYLGQVWGAIENSQLCGPKAFRFLERILWALGKGEPISFPSAPIEMNGDIPGFLLCSDTYPDQQELREQAVGLLCALRSFGEPSAAEGTLTAGIHQRLGVVTPVKSYLCRLTAYLLSKYAAGFNDEWGSRSHGKRGTRPLDPSKAG